MFRKVVLPIIFAGSSFLAGIGWDRARRRKISNYKWEIRKRLAESHFESTKPQNDLHVPASILKIALMDCGMDRLIGMPSHFWYMVSRPLYFSSTRALDLCQKYVPENFILGKVIWRPLMKIQNLTWLDATGPSPREVRRFGQNVYLQFEAEMKLTKKGCRGYFSRDSFLNTLNNARKQTIEQSRGGIPRVKGSYDSLSEEDKKVWSDQHQVRRGWNRVVSEFERYFFRNYGEDVTLEWLSNFRDPILYNSCRNISLDKLIKRHDGFLED